MWVSRFSQANAWSLLNPGLQPLSAFGLVGFSWRGGEWEVLPFRCPRCWCALLGLQVGQVHGGLMGIIQRATVKACPHVWFERSEIKDRHLVTKRWDVCWAASLERHRAVKDLHLGLSCRGDVQHTAALRMTWACLLVWALAQCTAVKMSASQVTGEAWNVYAACHGSDQRFWEGLDCRLSQSISVGKSSA